MTDDDDDQHPTRPKAQVERLTQTAVRRPASYAPAVSRLCRGLPTIPSDRRDKPRLDRDIWRGRLIDLER